MWSHTCVTMLGVGWLFSRACFRGRCWGILVHPKITTPGTIFYSFRQKFTSCHACSGSQKANDQTSGRNFPSYHVSSSEAKLSYSFFRWIFTTVCCMTVVTFYPTWVLDTFLRAECRVFSALDFVRAADQIKMYKKGDCDKSQKEEKPLHLHLCSAPSAAGWLTSCWVSSLPY